MDKKPSTPPAKRQGFSLVLALVMAAAAVIPGGGSRRPGVLARGRRDRLEIGTADVEHVPQLGLVDLRRVKLRLQAGDLRASVENRVRQRLEPLLGAGDGPVSVAPTGLLVSSRRRGPER